MIHTKDLQFQYDDIDFEATVTYSDVPFSQALRDYGSVFYNIVLHKPEVLACGGQTIAPSGGMASAMLFTKAGDRSFFYKEDLDIENEGNKTNIYPKVIDKILYRYFNKDKITLYRKKIEDFKEVVDKKYASQLGLIQEQRLVLRKRMRSAEISSKEYQKQYRPIRLKKEELESRVYWLKWWYEKRYFECCELKPKYRDYGSSREKWCLDRFGICGRLIAPYGKKQI